MRHALAVGLAVAILVTAPVWAAAPDDTDIWGYPDIPSRPLDGDLVIGISRFDAQLGRFVFADQAWIIRAARPEPSVCGPSPAQTAPAF